MTARVPLYTRRGWNAVAMVAGCALPAAAQVVPLDATGFNEDIVVEASLDVTVDFWRDGVSTTFDTPGNDYVWYESGLNYLDENQEAQPLPKGLPAGGSFTSVSDPTIQGQFQPFEDANNALLLDETNTTGTLTLVPEDQQSYDLLVVFASSASGGGVGTLFVEFTDGTTSDTISYNAQDWFFVTANNALNNLGRANLATEGADGTGFGEPRIYQTVISLAALGLADKEVEGIQFVKPDGAYQTAIFGISGLPDGAGIVPIAAAGWNRDIVVENTAVTPYADFADDFDTFNGYALYEAGLGDGTRGLPVGGAFTSVSSSLVPGLLQPYDEPNVLFLDSGSPTGTLTLDDPAAYASLVIFASSTNGGGEGSLVLNFANSSSSEPLPFNASDWFNATANNALSNLGRVSIGDDLFEAPFNNPRIYQTLIDLEAAGLSGRTITSITFTKPQAGGEAQNTAIFAISGQLSDGAPPACPADRDGDGDSDVQDLLAYLRAFRTGEADMDGDQDTDVQDLLGYLRAFRTGC